MKGVPARRLLLMGLILLGMILAGIGAVQIFGHHIHPHAVGRTGELYYCPMHPSYTSNHPGHCPICNMSLVKREREAPVSSQAPPEAALEDICTMHNCPKLHEGRPCPMMVMSKPGEKVTCPICGTHIVPGSEAVSPEGYSAVLLSPQKQQLIGVKTALVKKEKVVRTIRAAGRIAYDPELYQAEEEYLQASRSLKDAKETTTPEIAQQAERLVKATRMRLRLLGLSETLIDEMAGWDGADKSLLLSDPSGRIWVYAAVYEFELPLVKVGQVVMVDLPAIPGKTFEGVIRSIDPVLDPMTRSARVRAVLTDPEKLLKPEMYVNVSVKVDLGEVVTIPREAVFDTGTKRIVFVDKGQGILEPREVTVGVQADSSYEVKGGVEEGESVVINGNFLIDSESRLKSALQGMGDSGQSGRASTESGGSAMQGGGEHHHGP